MPILSLQSINGIDYKVDLPEPMEGLASAFLFAFPKSGSTLMDNMVTRYCESLKIPTFSLFNGAFDAGIPTNKIMQDASVCFASGGMIYLGFRHYPDFDLDLSGLRSVLLVRDPRDMLVSLYYSVVKSHIIPTKHRVFQKRREAAAKLDVDEFVLKKAGAYLLKFKKYQQKLPSDSLVTYRYEDVIYEKSAWLEDLVNKLGLPSKPELIQETAQKFDVFPESEDQEQHIRQVHPGNYKSRLQQDTINALNEKLSQFLQYYNYL